MKRPNIRTHTVINGTRYRFKSKLESRYAQFLELLRVGGAILMWEYEVKTFWFETIRRGVTNYKPDFKVTCNDLSVQWHECKGYVTRKDATKFRRMKKYHPNDRCVLVMQDKRKSQTATLREIEPFVERIAFATDLFRKLKGWVL